MGVCSMGGLGVLYLGAPKISKDAFQRPNFQIKIIYPSYPKYLSDPKTL